MSFIVPEKIFEQHTIIFGKTRSGKSSVARLCVEHLLDRGEPVVILDPKGDWWGLKSSATGKRAGYPVVIFGGDHGDVPINAKSGAVIAELVATGNRSAILDLGGWMPSARTAFFVDFASTYFRITRGRRWLVIDEVHNFAPQGKVLDPQSGKMLHWANRLANEGLGKGVSLIACSQRPQKVHKDFVTSAETLIALRVIHPLDRRATQEWIDGCGDPTKGKEVLETLASNKRGEGWVWSPEIGFGPRRMQFPLFSTFDSFKPQDSHLPAKLKGWADVDLADVKSKLESVVKEAEANDPAKLRAQIRELEKQKPTPQTKLSITEDRAYRELLAERDKELSALRRQLESFASTLREISSRAGTVLGQKFVSKAAKVKPAAAGRAVEIQTPMTGRTFTSVSLTDVVAKSDGEEKLRSGAERMLAALAQWHPSGMSEGQMRAHAGLKKSGTFSAYMSDLRRGAFIVEQNGEVFASERGLEYCKHVPAVPRTTDEVVEIWNKRLRDGARRMLAILVDLGGEAISREELMERAELAKSGTASAYLSDLRTARLILVNRDGTVAANPETLFLGSRAA